MYTIRHIANEPFFIRCGDNLRDSQGNQVATITGIDAISLELRTDSSDPETWSEAVTEAEGFSSVQILNDPASPYSADMIGGLISIGGASPQPGAGSGYAIVAHCEITMTAAYGGGTAKRDFVLLSRIAPSFETAPAS